MKKSNKDPDCSFVRMWRHGLLLGLLFAIAGSFSTSYAQNTPSACSANEAGCRLNGGFNAASARNLDANGAGISYTSSPSFGAFIYEDFKPLEAEARSHLNRALGVRESISPYQGKIGFDQFINQLDGEVGLSEVYTQTTAYGSGLTRNALLDKVESDLDQTRDLYSFLAVFAPEARFRSDNDYIGGSKLCGAADKEDPNPEDPGHTGLVLPPVVDWCDFKARLRQSVREAANIRMMVGQQFMVNALGMNFSSDTVGGEAYVRQEVAQLRAAQNQFKLAEQNIAGALTHVIGNGCLISDFFTEGEWSLLTRSADSQASTQFLIGTRLSYLNGPSLNGVTQAKANAIATYRRGAADGYVKMVGMAAMGRADRANCDRGEHPDDSAVAAMALNLLDAQRQAQDLASGRNIFGFDVTFTPNRPYKSSTAADCKTNSNGNRGLWDEAFCDTQEAAVLQDRAEQAQRDYDQSQTALRDSANTLLADLDKHIDDTVGCTRRDIGNDKDFFDCASKQIALGEHCLTLVSTGIDNQSGADTDDVFDKCLAQMNQSNDATTALHDLRNAYLDYLGVRHSEDNINKRVQASNEANTSIRTTLILAGIADTAAHVTQALLDGADCEDFDNEVSAIASAAACGTTATANAVAQGFVGGLSSIADVTAQDQETNKEITNLVLDQSELHISARSAFQAYRSKYSDTEGLFTALERDVDEDIHQHAYFSSSPANDPTFRIVRDSARLQAADALEIGAKIGYLAARRAEYEYAARLSASGFSISDIYRARTPQDIINFLNKLRDVTDNLSGGTTQEIQPVDFTISVARDVVPFNDDQSLSKDGFTTPDQSKTERLKRFRAWVATNTVTDTVNGRSGLRFVLTTSLNKHGLFDNLIGQSDLRWRLMLGGIGSPDPSNSGVSINVVTDQQGLSRRTVLITQGGLVHLRSQAGCIFDYKLIAPAVLLGYEWSKTQSPEQTPSLFSTNVNNAHVVTESGFRSKAFEGRSVSSTAWVVTIFSDEPGLPAMQLQQLNDIELHMSASYTARTPGAPDPSECSRLDF